MAALNNRYTVLVPSTDQYSDLWKPFLFYLDRFWNWRTENVVLGSNFMSTEFSNATVCTTGASRYWGEHVLKLLDFVETDKILLMMPDFFLTKEVEYHLFSYYLDLFQHEQLKCLALTPRSLYGHESITYPGCKAIKLDGAYSVSTEISLWRVDALRDVLRPNDSPWSFERASRIEYEDPRYWCFATEPVFHYAPTGALIRGSWSRNALRMLKHDGLKDCLGDRPVLSRKKSILYGTRSLAFRLTSLTWPNLIRLYNLHILKSSGQSYQ